MKSEQVTDDEEINEEEDLDEDEDEEEDEQDDLDEGDAIDEANLVSLSPPSYQNTKQSLYFIKAKILLSEGKFEVALSLLSKGMRVLLETLSSLDTTSDNKEGTNDLHQAMAPFYYLYGTTLLYSVEEGGKDGGNAETQVMNAPEDEEGQNDDNNNTSLINQEDLQIAWENLDLARSILSAFMREGHSHPLAAHSTPQTEEPYELESDLAQIHLRLGDLSRHNGHYLDAVQEYEESCRIRRKICEILDISSSAAIVPMCRKIADVEYLLGMTCMLVAAEGAKNLEDSTAHETDDDDGVAKIHLSPSQISQYRGKSTQHYLECGKMLSLVIASICGIQSELWKATIESITSHSNGLPFLLMSSSPNVWASSTIREIRNRVAQFPKCATVEDASTVLELGELLDEIQETIDAADADSVGLQDVARMKKMAMDAASQAQDEDLEGGEQVNGFGVTTQIGFGTSTKPEMCNVIHSSNGTGTTNGIHANNGTAPGGMMIVKKKKKRDDSQMDDSTENADKKMKQQGK